MAQTYAAKCLLKAAASAPRDLISSFIATYKPIHPRLAPCPFQAQGIMLNPDGGLFFCENSDVVGNVVQEDAEVRAAREKHNGAPPRLTTAATSTPK